MSVERAGLIDRPGGPRIHLASAAGALVSVCLTAPDRAQDVAGQTAQILAVIDRHLAELGARRDTVLMAQVWLADIRDHAAFNATWNGWIVPGAEPALSVVQAAASRRDTLVEIRVYASRG